MPSYIAMVVVVVWFCLVSLFQSIQRTANNNKNKKKVRLIPRSSRLILRSITPWGEEVCRNIMFKVFELSRNLPPFFPMHKGELKRGLGTKYPKALGEAIEQG